MVWLRMAYIAYVWRLRGGDEARRALSSLSSLERARARRHMWIPLYKEQVRLPLPHFLPLLVALARCAGGDRAIYQQGALAVGGGDHDRQPYQIFPPALSGSLQCSRSFAGNLRTAACALRAKPFTLRGQRCEGAWSNAVMGALCS
jgi:hypothetical protein